MINRRRGLEHHGNSNVRTRASLRAGRLRALRWSESGGGGQATRTGRIQVRGRHAPGRWRVHTVARSERELAAATVGARRAPILDQRCRDERRSLGIRHQWHRRPGEGLGGGQRSFVAELLVGRRRRSRGAEPRRIAAGREQWNALRGLGGRNRAPSPPSGDAGRTERCVARWKQLVGVRRGRRDQPGWFASRRDQSRWRIGGVGRPDRPRRLGPGGVWPAPPLVALLGRWPDDRRRGQAG